jgi:nucleoid-associated protein YgaU
MKRQLWPLVCLGVLLLILGACTVPTISQVAAPAIRSPDAGATLSEGEVDVAGTAAPGAAVEVLVDGQVRGTARAGADGAWSVEIASLEPGEHELTVRQTLDIPGVAAAMSEPVVVKVSAAEAAAAEPAAPSLRQPAAGAELEAGPTILGGTAEPGAQVQVLVDGQVAAETQTDDDGAWSVEVADLEPGEHEITLKTGDAGGAVTAASEPVMLTVGPAAAAPRLLFPSDGADVITGRTIVGRLTLIGAGEPGSQVEIVDGSDALTTVEVGANGEWRYTFEPEAGTHQFAARAAADPRAGSAVARVRVAGPDDDIDCTSNPGIERRNTYIVGTCDTLSDIGQRLGVELDVVIAANPEIADPDLIFPGQVVSIPQ